MVDGLYVQVSLVLLLSAAYSIVVLTYPAATLNVSAPAILGTDSVLVVSSMCESFMDEKVAGMAEMSRMCVRIIVNGNSEDSHQVFSVLGTGVLHLSRFGLSSLTTDPAQIV